MNPHHAASPKIGVLALQGAFQAHAAVLSMLGAIPVEVRLPDDLDGLDGLILPGGESTTMLRFLELHGFLDRLRDFVHTHPTFGTCAGAILLAHAVQNPPQPSLDAIDITVERNAYGRQLDSCIQTAATTLPGGPLEMVFIRAPRILQVGPAVTVLATRDDHPVLVRQGDVLAATFHPELSSDQRIHRLFLQMVQAHQAAAVRPATGSPASAPRASA
ncbi:MAG: pyridoxal 5'-phosphate synthase glutaminase subunit PdxT [Acidobacteriota bacterium]|nr:pyridoxal 5'-phosphate synthase glutaminase subunit PdxT [Acidobacteriota bacterium]